MTPVDEPPAGPRFAGLGRVGEVLSRLAGAQGLPRPDLDALVVVTAGDGSVQDGRDAADRSVDAGRRLLVVEGTDSVGALVVCAALLDLEPVAALGTAPHPEWAARLGGVRDGLARVRAHVGEPERLLEVAGEPGLLAGVVAEAAARRTPLLLDGSAQAAAALLVADRLAPGAARWCVAGSAPATPGARAALDDLGVEPLLDLGVERGGAALALALLREGLVGA